MQPSNVYVFNQYNLVLVKLVAKLLMSGIMLDICHQV